VGYHTEYRIARDQGVASYESVNGRMQRGEHGQEKMGGRTD